MRATSPLEIRESLGQYETGENQRPSLTVILPCHNEEDNIERVVEQALEVLPRVSRDFEIIVVDDASTDRTRERVEVLCVGSSSITILRHLQREGYGSALRTGLKAATKDWVLYTHGNAGFDLGQLSQLLEQRQGAGAVLGYRPKWESVSPGRNDLPWRNWFARFFFGLKVHDVDCLFKLFRREDVKIGLESRGPFISTELLVRLKKKGVFFREVEIS